MPELTHEELAQDLRDAICPHCGGNSDEHCATCNVQWVGVAETVMDLIQKEEVTW